MKIIINIRPIPYIVLYLPPFTLVEESQPLTEQNGLELYWESTYAIAMSLMEKYPDSRPEEVGLAQLTEMIIMLPGFADDPSMVTERILLDIQIVWFEEALTL